MRGATHPGPENTYFLATQCCRCDEKGTEGKSRTKRMQGARRSLRTKTNATASSQCGCSWRWWCKTKWGWEDWGYVGFASDAKRRWQSLTITICIYTVSTLSFSTPPSPSFLHHSSIILLLEWHICRDWVWPWFLFLSVPYLGHFSSKHFCSFFTLFRLSTSMLILSEWCEIKIFSLPAPASASLWLSVGK